jgi:hypothetical protein
MQQRRATRAAKRAVIQAALEEEPHLSDRGSRRRSFNNREKPSQTTEGKVRGQLSSSSENGQPTQSPPRVTGRDGRAYPARKGVPKGRPRGERNGHARPPRQPPRPRPRRSPRGLPRSLEGTRVGGRRQVEAIRFHLPGRPGQHVSVDSPGSERGRAVVFPRQLQGGILISGRRIDPPPKAPASGGGARIPPPGPGPACFS